jgi:hypothetical protein
MPAISLDQLINCHKALSTTTTNTVILYVLNYLTVFKTECDSRRFKQTTRRKEMSIQEIRQHITDLYNQETIPQANALAALEYLSNRNINGAIGCIISYI